MFEKIKSEQMMLGSTEEKKMRLEKIVKFHLSVVLLHTGSRTVYEVHGPYRPGCTSVEHNRIKQNVMTRY